MDTRKSYATDRLGQRQQVGPGHLAHLIHRRRRLLKKTWAEEAAIVDVSMSGMLVRRTIVDPALTKGAAIRVDIGGQSNTMRVARIETARDAQEVGLTYVRLHCDVERFLQGLSAGGRDSKDWYWELDR